MEENTTPSSYSPPPASPPPPQAPPPIFLRPSPPPPRRGRGWMVFAIILLVLLIFSVFLNMGSFLAHSLAPGKIRSSRAVGPRLEEVMTEDNDSANKIAVVEIGGIISSS